MKKFTLIAAALAFSAAASAGTDQTNFNVSVSVTPVCKIKTGASDINFGTYTPFTQTTITLANATSATFRCSHGLTPTIGFDASDAARTASATGTGAPTAEGVLAGLRYTMTGSTVAAALSAGSAGTVAVAGAGGTGGVDSVAKEYTFSISAVMAGGQAGDTSGTTSHQRTLMMTY
ncbi:hypothetical protein GCM10027034_33740 [Ramlibacter solisilvae]|uniref:Spore coat protein U domain-containing protein n=1 Tax=Ramlibacter tataouinensis TaxID=94132 RepID=A0A127JXT5_9BURK|nr:hypothetical protein [Ramlibacter tataouinensis]AMO22882.1 hypothetical protein UC35_08240 [Ramlibacter tataouinensis]